MSEQSTKDAVHTASATTTDGSVGTDDGVVTADLVRADAPAEGATTPEHLVAAGLAGCMQQAVVMAASSLGADVSPQVSATVRLHGQGTGLSMTVDLTVSGLDGDHADDILAAARSYCPVTSALSESTYTLSRAE